MFGYRNPTVWGLVHQSHKTHTRIEALREGDTTAIKADCTVIPVLLTSRIQWGHIHSYVSMFYSARLLSHVKFLAQIGFSRPKDRIVKTAKFSLVDKCRNRNFLFQKFG